MFRLTGFAAIVTPWRSIYILTEWIDEPGLRAHELTHIAQLDRDGALLFWTRCIWYVVRHGYWNSPYEVECRVAEDAARMRETVNA